MDMECSRSLHAGRPLAPPSPHTPLPRHLRIPRSPRSQERRERRNSGDGPSVPQEFREAALAESSRSHEWRQKLMRLVVGNSRGTSRHASRDGSPVCAVRRDEADQRAEADGGPRHGDRESSGARSASGATFFVTTDYVP